MIFINDVAYKEFKELLDESKVDSYNIRIGIDSLSCSGPIFGIMVSEATEKDETEIINDITFIVDKDVLEQYGGFIIVSSKENNGNGVGLKPVVQPTSGCSSCSGGCH